jgi:hypothetical protein
VWSGQELIIRRFLLDLGTYSYFEIFLWVFLL